MENRDIDALAYQAVFAEDKEKARVEIKLQAQKRGIKIASLLPLYSKIAQEKLSGFTIPAFNLRGLTYEIAGSLFKAAQELKAGVFIFELARSERGYTQQSFEEYSSLILAAALKNNFSGPIFLQLDHLQINPSRYQKSLKEEEEEVKKLILEALQAGFLNFDIDASSLGFEDNIATTIRLINDTQENPKTKPLNFGSELEEIGGKNTQVKDLDLFIKKVQKGLKDKNCLTKIAVQTGTKHGGLVTKGGGLKKIEPDFVLLKALGEKARSFGLAGVVQHGASTLADELFSRFPEADTLEIHLATGIQNLIFDHPVFPPALKEKMKAWVLKNSSSEGSSEEEVFYKQRKKIWGEFKKELLDLPKEVKEPILLTVKEKFAFWFRSLGVENTLSLIKDVY